MKLDILSDPVCPWCYIGKAHLDRALAARPDHPFEIEWHPFQLNPDMPPDGMDRRAYLEAKFGGRQNATHTYLRIAEAAEAAGLPKWVKLEIHPDPNYLLPDPIETFEAAKTLVEEGFTVLPYINADPVLALLGLGSIVLGAVTYAFSTRFQAEAEGHPEEPAMKRALDELEETDDPRADGARTYAALRDVGASSFSFLVPDVSRDTRALFYPDVVDGDLARFMTSAFDVWLAEPEVVPVGLFADAVDKLTGGHGRTDAFGGEGLSYLIYETNGAYEVLDALKVCGEGMTKLPVDADLEAIVARPEIARFVAARAHLPTACRPCRFAAACRGGYLPPRYDSVRGFDNPSAWCSDLYAFWTHVHRRLGEAAGDGLAA